MSYKINKNVIVLENSPHIISSAAVVGKAEGEGPLKDEFDYCYPDDGMNMTTWEKAESKLLEDAINISLEKARLEKESIDLVFSGDLMNQCTASSYAVRQFEIPFVGLFGACSTMALGMALSALLTDSGIFKNVLASVSSHFCSAEKQFRYPLEYGGQRTPCAQRTVTGAGACIFSSCSKSKIAAKKIMFGKIVDFGVRDMSNMGAAMAPAAARTISDFLRETGTSPSDYSKIITGDLGFTGSELLRNLMKDEEKIDISSVHDDCGMMIFNREEQDVHSGGSGCACSGTVMCSKIFRLLSEGALENVLFVGTGALMSPLISYQGETIPGIAHAILLKSE